LTIFDGEYLTWPDSDDFLDAQSIEKKVKFLDSNPAYGLVRTDAYKIDEGNDGDILGFISRKRENRFKENLFNDLILENTYITCGCYMVRSEAFFTSISSGEIYESNGGQNWQMLLPITHKYKCGFIDEPLYTYVVRKNSHSHSIEGKEKELKRCDEHEDILTNVLSNINEINQEKYFAQVQEKYIRKKMRIAIKYKDRELRVRMYKLLTDNGWLNVKDRVWNRILCKEIFGLALYEYGRGSREILKGISRKWRIYDSSN
ncbi:MAG: glycosyltransferase, partial [Oscillospiraceae bacterium]|nr:glycosyltransferase [Oscillospiraceae bacterium]